MTRDPRPLLRAAVVLGCASALAVLGCGTTPTEAQSSLGGSSTGGQERPGAGAPGADRPGADGPGETAPRPPLTPADEIAPPPPGRSWTTRSAGPTLRRRGPVW